MKGELIDGSPVAVEDRPWTERGAMHVVGTNRIFVGHGQYPAIRREREAGGAWQLDFVPQLRSQGPVENPNDDDTSLHVHVIYSSQSLAVRRPGKCSEKAIIRKDPTAHAVEFHAKRSSGQHRVFEPVRCESHLINRDLLAVWVSGIELQIVILLAEDIQAHHS